MKVSTYEQQVTRQPVSPNLNPDPNAFGANVAQATQQLGNITQNVGQLIDKRRLEQQQEKDFMQVLEFHTQMLKDMDDLSYNPELDENGKPKGLMKREGKNADGATVDFDKRAEEIRLKYAGMLKGENQQIQFAKLFKGTYDSTRSQVIKFEAAQNRAVKIQTINDTVIQLVNDAAKNPLALMDTADKINAIIKVSYTQIAGSSEESIRVDQQKYVGQATVGAVQNLLDKGNYKDARILADKVKDKVDGVTWEKIDTAINTGVWNNEKDATSTVLVSKYGEDISKGDKEIKAMGLTAEKQNELLETYHNHVIQFRQEKSAAQEAQMDWHYTKIEKAGNGLAAMKYIDGLSQRTPDELQMKVNLKTMAKQLYPELSADGSSVKTDPNSYWQLREDVISGKVSNINQMRVKYGNSVSLADMKTFANILDKGKTMKTLISECNDYIAKSKIKDQGEQAKIWDYVDKAVDIFKEQNKRGPNQEEQTAIIKKATIKVVAGRWQFGPLSGDIKESRYNIPNNAQYSENLKAWVYQDENGNWLKYNP